MQKKILVISAPSGTGKNTLIDLLLQKRHDLQYSVSSTTRPARGREENGIHYHFLTAQEFEKKIERDEFLEWAKVLQNYYGTEKSEIEKIHAQNKLPILDIDVQGALQLKQKFPQTVVTIFILPPSIEILQERLEKRATESVESIARRISLAREEMQAKDKYDFRIVNDELVRAVDDLSGLIDSQLL